ncbi:unnamed protein product [Cylicostephanus goldi]|uniref:Uncharacterized protein n=1 Tax=Cylicostephanus goldi TaxID=71465 RepID=A0A3P6S099_CYLGO|nr:unnamed protein product [Cylicostephanus goldi]
MNKFAVMLSWTVSMVDLCLLLDQLLASGYFGFSCSIYAYLVLLRTQTVRGLEISTCLAATSLVVVNVHQLSKLWITRI